jgi:hypothetical protein
LEEQWQCAEEKVTMREVVEEEKGRNKQWEGQ